MFDILDASVGVNFVSVSCLQLDINAGVVILLSLSYLEQSRVLFTEYVVVVSYRLKEKRSLPQISEDFQLDCKRHRQ